MALMLAKLYTALREAGVDDVKAREAAEEVASFENRLANVEASLMILKWMVGFNLVLAIAIVGMLFFVLAYELAANAAATDTANAGASLTRYFDPPSDQGRSRNDWNRWEPRKSVQQ